MFFDKNQYCCFCGGMERATQEDHVPPKSMFLGRNWPVGYAFPACGQCNNGTAIQDRQFALATFMSRRQLNEAEKKQWRALLAEVKKDHPGLVEQMLLSANQKRRWINEVGMSPPS